jgi:uncharacterized protein (DUF4415 family)
MPKSKPVTGSNLKRVDAHVIQPEEYDDTPEITDEMLERADLYDGDKLIKAGKGGPNPRVAQAIRRTAGRPRLENPKRAIKLRLDAEVVEHFRKAGPGWQTRINEALRRALQSTPAKPAATAKKVAAAKKRAAKKAAAAKSASPAKKRA